MNKNIVISLEMKLRKQMHNWKAQAQTQFSFSSIKRNRPGDPVKTPKSSRNKLIWKYKKNATFL